MSHNVRFLVNVPNFGEFADIRAVADLAREAEAAGWDGFFTWDHVVTGGPPPWAGGFDLRAALPAYAEAGLTWWIESCGGEPGSFADLRERVLAGPPR